MYVYGCERSSYRRESYNFLIPIINTLISEDEVADRAIDASLIVEKLAKFR